MSGWFKVRILLCVLGFVEGVVVAVTDNGAMRDVPLGFAFAMIPVVAFFSIVALLLVIGFQVKNPLQNTQWVVPDWDSNILNLKQPLNFFHAGAYSIIASGAGCVIGSVFGGIAYVAEGAMMLSGGMGILWGIKKCSKLYKNKFSLGAEEIAGEETVPKRDGAHKILLKFIGGAILFSGLVLFVLSLVFLNKTIKFMDNAVEADGVIVGFEEELSDGSKMYRPIFEFTDGVGDTHKGMTSWSSTNPKYEEGDAVALVYDAEEIDDVRINSFASTWLIPVFIGGMGVVEILIGSIVLFFTFLKLKPTSKNSCSV